MTSVITATALVVRPPDGTAGSAYREIGRVRSRTSTIRMTSLARFHRRPQLSHAAEASSFRTAVAIAQRYSHDNAWRKRFFKQPPDPPPTWHECYGLDRVDEQVGLCERWRFQC